LSTWTEPLAARFVEGGRFKREPTRISMTRKGQNRLVGKIAASFFQRLFIDLVYRGPQGFTAIACTTGKQDSHQGKNR
jgi:hypothetical protein